MTMHRGETATVPPTREGCERSPLTRLANGVPTTRHPLDTRDDSLYSDDSGSTSPQGPLPPPTPVPVVQIPPRSPVSSPGAVILSEEEEERSIFEAVLSPDCRDVRLTRDSSAVHNRRRIPLPDEYLHKTTFRRDTSSYAKRSGGGGRGGDDSESASTDGTVGTGSGSESVDEIEDSILGSPIGCDRSSIGGLSDDDDPARWRLVTVAGIERKIDMSVIEPYKRVLSHGGYMEDGSPIIVFGACFLPHRSRLDYAYVMENLFHYVVSTLEDLVTDDYILVYLHGGAPKHVVPKFSWLKRSYQMIDHRLRKNLRRLYLVHPTFWLRTIVAMTRPFVSAKFSRKVTFVDSLSALFDALPLEGAAVPERVHQFDRLKQSVRPPKK